MIFDIETDSYERRYFQVLGQQYLWIYREPFKTLFHAPGPIPTAVIF